MNKFFRYFRVRKYEHISLLALIKFIFSLSALGVLFCLLSPVYGEDYFIFGVSFVILSLCLCILLPFRLSFLCVFLLVLFVPSYFEFIFFLNRLFVFLGVSL